MQAWQASLQQSLARRIELLKTMQWMAFLGSAGARHFVLIIVLLLNTSSIAHSNDRGFYDISTFTMAGVFPGISREETISRLTEHFSIEESELRLIRTGFRMPIVELDNVVQFISYKKGNTNLFIEFTVDLDSVNRNYMVLSSIKMRSKERSSEKFLAEIIEEYGKPTILSEEYFWASWCSKDALIKPYDTESCDREKPSLYVNEFGATLIDPKYALTYADHILKWEKNPDDYEKYWKPSAMPIK